MWESGQTRASDAKHKRWRNAVLQRDPCCQLKYGGCTGLAEEADHILSWAERPDLAYAIENGQGACAKCHSTKTQREATAAKQRRAARGKYQQPGKHPGLI